MKISVRLLAFTLALTAMTVLCKYLFGSDIAWSGFTPVLAIALFSGFIFRDKSYSFILPLLALVISDAVIQVLYSNGLFPYAGFYEGQWKNYLLLLSVTIAGWLLQGRSYGSLAAGVLLAPTIYFLLSNFLVWAAPASEAMYPKNFSGLMICYEAALPFYKNSTMSTVLFLPVILLLYNYLTRNKPVLRLA